MSKCLKEYGPNIHFFTKFNFFTKLLGIILSIRKYLDDHFKRLTDCQDQVHGFLYSCLLKETSCSKDSKYRAIN